MGSDGELAGLDEHGRPEPPHNADEAGTVSGFLDFLRATIAWKRDGLDADALSATLGPSTMTLGGLMKHLAFVEDYWFSYQYLGDEPGEPWASADWDADPDWDWHSAADDTPEQLEQLWRDAVERSRAVVRDALAQGGLDQLSARTRRDGTAVSLRWILCHMVEEYARHCGHADLLRESIDGTTGE